MALLTLVGAVDRRYLLRRVREAMKFYVGIYQSGHLNYVKDRFCYSYRRLSKFKNKINIPPYLEWILDSGAFQELRLNGRYTYTPEDYFKKVLEYRPDLFVNMDYMCEPLQLKKTGLTMEKHQELSLENQIILGELADSEGLELMGTIQGWEPQDYIKHIDLLREHGQIRPHMGIGSVCRRHAIKEILMILRAIRDNMPSWVKLHGFGIKTSLLKYPEVYELIDSCDSMAWSYRGRMAGVHEVGIGGTLFGRGCLVSSDHIRDHHTDDCANCGRYMSAWVDDILKLIEENDPSTSWGGSS